MLPSSMLARATSLGAVQSVTSMSYELRIDEPGPVSPGARDGKAG